MEDKLKPITVTTEGYPIKNLRFLKLDNIIVGHVKCPLFGKPDLHDGYISCIWNTHGFPLKVNKGRNELRLNLS